MAGRNLVFANGEYYHIFNRGIARQPVFFTKRDNERFLLTLDYDRYANIPVKLSRYLQLSADTKNSFLLHRQKNDSQIEIVSYVSKKGRFSDNHMNDKIRRSDI